jgi:phosphohistidine phosphatase
VTQLYLLRHAHAGDRGTWHGDDDERPLSDKGRRQAETLGRFLAQVGFRPDVIVTSPKTRALQTAEIVGMALHLEVSTDVRLADGFRLGTAEKLLAELDADRPVLVGHDPDLSMLVEALAGTDAIPIKKGALCRVDADRPLKPGSGTVRWLLPPDLFLTTP